MSMNPGPPPPSKGEVVAKKVSRFAGKNAVLLAYIAGLLTEFVLGRF